MEQLDNREKLLRDDLQKTLKRNSKVSIAAECFSIYAFHELQKKLEKVKEVNFIFTEPIFVKENPEELRKNFYIDSLQREKNICGTEFEVKLKNELNQQVIAKDCAKWIEDKVTFKGNMTKEYMPGFINVDNTSYFSIRDFTTVDLGCERGDNVYYPIIKTEAHENNNYYINIFDELWNDAKRLKDVTEEVLERIALAYKENSPEFVYYFTLYNIFSERLDDLSDDTLDDKTGFKETQIWNTLYDFQKDAVAGLINKLEKYNGCILADSVGLGKTYTSLAVIKYYEDRNKSVLVLCPKKLSENWNTYKGNYINNPLKDDRLRYDVLYHTDLSREKGESNGIDLNRLNWSNYDLVVIDESHNFRNGGMISKDGKENRYLKLMNKVIKQGIKTKVLMLSATPVNNKFIDLKRQIELAYEGDTEFIDNKLKTKKSIDDIFRQSQRSFTNWNKLAPEERCTDNLLQELDSDFFELLDSVTIARSRKNIKRYYDTTAIGKFPKRLKPISKRPSLTDLPKAINYNEIYEQLMSLNLTIYTPSNYIFASRKDAYESLNKNIGITQIGREAGIRKLMSINLLKRLESSVYSFQLTLKRVEEYIKDTLKIIDSYKAGSKEIDLLDVSNVDFDADDQNQDIFTVGKKVKIDLNDMDYLSWERDLKEDVENLELLNSMIEDIKPQHDSKLQSLLSLIDQKIENPINKGNKKLLIFTAFSDTADYLYHHVSTYAKEKYGLETAEITGSVEGKSTIKGQKMDFNAVLTLFSPVSKGRDMLLSQKNQEIDILIATDCISEGQNLQDCDYLINYDIHWNPVRIVQRFGRIDRIGSKNNQIQLVNFWPDMDLDEYINLKSRVEDRMKLTVLTSTGDDNPINPEEKGDLEYRRAQLKRLQEEVVDLEDMTDGISITDLGWNEYRMELLKYLKEHPELETVPTGLHTLVPTQEELPQGIVFVLKNINHSVERDDRNRVDPFYLVYVADDGEIIIDYFKAKELLDILKLLTKGYAEPIYELCKQFNEQTNNGSDMTYVSNLLSEAINSIINKKEESDIDSLFTPGGTSALLASVNELDDFELISFFVVR